MNGNTCKCPKCNASVSYPSHMEGKLISCSECSHVFTASGASRSATTSPKAANERTITGDRRRSSFVAGLLAATLVIGIVSGIALSGFTCRTHKALWVSNVHNVKSRGGNSSSLKEYEHALNEGGYIGLSSDLCDKITGNRYNMSFDQVVLCEIGKHGWKLIQVEDRTNFYFVK